MMLRRRFSSTGTVHSSRVVAAALLFVVLQYLFLFSSGSSSSSATWGAGAGAASSLSASQVEEELVLPGERDALIQLRDILSSSASNNNNSNNHHLHGNWTGPPCYKNQSRWAGIGCSNSHVTHLVLEGLQLTASLPPMLLQSVTFLTKLSFRNNSLNGPLPNLSNLRELEFLFLSGNQFSGSIPAAYTQLPKLTKLELQQNSLGGTIPPFDQETLIAFNVSHNQLAGPIPETSTLLKFSKSSYDFNSNLCGRPLQVQCPVSPPPPPPANGSAPLNPAPAPAAENREGQLKVWIIVLIAAGVVALAAISIILCFLCPYYKRIRVTKPTSEQPGSEGFADITTQQQKRSRSRSRQWSESTTDDPERRVELEFFDKSRAVFDLDDLLRASAEVIGKGKLGTTYKATLECGLVVAVNRLIRDVNGVSSKEFIQQMQSLGKLRHQNLAEIISYYYSKDEKLIIYEHVSSHHGNLFDLLHENRGIGRQPLNWSTRLSIIKGIAKALSFLHQSLPSSSHNKVPHGNLRSSSVVINLPRSQCKLTDYGLLPLLPSRKSSQQKLAVGMYAPEFLQGKKLTAKADVYCFGILLLEIITGKTPSIGCSRGGGGGNNHHHQEEAYDTVDDLSEWVRSVVNRDWSTDILDVEIVAEKEGYDEMLKLTNIALDCTAIAPENRPKMCQVLARIEEACDCGGHDS